MIIISYNTFIISEATDSVFGCGVLGNMWVLMMMLLIVILSRSWSRGERAKVNNTQEISQLSEC